MLNPKNMAEVRDAIYEACRGKKIRTNGFGLYVHINKPVRVSNPNRGCCPLGALIMERGPFVPDAGDDELDFLKDIGLPREWVRSFYRGFDDSPFCQTDSWAYKLGRHFRNLYDQGKLGKGCQ